MRDITLKSMTVPCNRRICNSKKRVVGIQYTLKREKYDDDSIVLDLDDIIDVILDYHDSKSTSYA